MPVVLNRHHPTKQVLTPFSQAVLPPKQYVGRGTPWGNRNVKSAESERYKVLEAFLSDLCSMDVRRLHHLLVEIKGKDLECSCAPKPCHADIWLALANNLPAPRWMMPSLRKQFDDLKARIGEI